MQSGRVGRFALALLVLMIVLISSPAWAWRQEADVDDARLSRIEREIETLSRSVYKGEKPTGPLPGMGADTAAVQGQFDERMTRLEQDLRELTNRVEGQGNDLHQARTEVDRVLADLQNRMLAMEQKLGVASPAGITTVVPPVPSSIPPVAVGAPEAANNAIPPAALPLTAPNDPAPANSPTVQSMGTVPTDGAAVDLPPVNGDPTQMYENAITLLKQRDYKLAEKTLNDFLTAYPTHNLAANAKYWLGEAYFAQNKYDKAARIFAEGYQKYPKGQKAADNLLKLGLSLSAMGNKPDACVALQQIGKDFPRGANAVATRAQQEIKRLSCGA